MRYLLILILLLVMFVVCGCESVKLDGFSIGAAYLNTDLTNEYQNTKVEGLMPIGLLNFRFE